MSSKCVARSIISKENRFICPELINEYKTVTNDTILLNPTQSFKSQVDTRFGGKDNTLYVIDNTFDLYGESIQIPSHVVLHFAKGGLYNGTLEGFYTHVTSECDYIFNDVVFKGNWNAVRSRPEWFGAVGDDNKDDTYAFKSLANFSGRSLFDKMKTYLINDYIFLKSSNVEWDLNESTIKFYDNKDFSLYVSQVENVIIRNGNIEGNRIGDASNLEYGITIDASKNIVVEDIYFSKFSRDGIYVGYEWSDPDEELHRTENIIISECVFDNVARNGITIGAGENIVVANCVFKNINTTFPKSGIDIEPENISKTKFLNFNNIHIHDCVFDNCRLAISVYQSNYNYPDGDVFISNVECNNSILYIENIKMDGGFNTYVKNITFKDCKNACIQITNPCSKMKTQLKNVHIKPSQSIFDFRKTAALEITANGDRTNIGGVSISDINLDDTSYSYVIAVSHTDDKKPGKLHNLSVKRISKKGERSGRNLILAERDILDGKPFKARRAIKKKINYK